MGNLNLWVHGLEVGSSLSLHPAGSAIAALLDTLVVLALFKESRYQVLQEYSPVASQHPHDADPVRAK